MSAEDPAREARETLKQADEADAQAVAVLADAEMVKAGQRSAYLARRLGLSKRTIRSWCQSGKIDADQLPSGRWRIALAEVQRLVAISEK